MAYHRVNRCVIFTCTQCSTRYGTPFDQFGQALKMIKGAGWVTRLFVKGWGHFCSDNCLYNHMQDGLDANARMAR